MPALCRHPHSKTYNFTGRGFESRRFSALGFWPGPGFGLVRPVLTHVSNTMLVCREVSSMVQMQTLPEMQEDSMWETWHLFLVSGMAREN